MKANSFLQRQFLFTALAFSAGLLLSACSGGSGADTESNPVPPPPVDVSNYKGPLPKNAEVKRFMDEFWGKLVSKCGACHSDKQEPRFVRTDDINLAYQAALTVVDLTDPARSRIVAKVGSGHNCWLPSATACGDTMTVYIKKWASSSGGSVTEVTLSPPTIKDPGSSRLFPVDPGLFITNVWTPYLRPHCAACHSEDANKPQQPFFASPDQNVAYAAVRDSFKIDLDHPALSRLVVRLAEESHNCWTTNCATFSASGQLNGGDAKEMLDGIQKFADGVPVITIDPALVYSKALRMVDGIVASSGGRYEESVIAQWLFKEGSGLTAFDTSGVDPATNLVFNGDVSWVGGYGINIKGDAMHPARAQASTTASKKIYSQIKLTGEYTLETWIAPANVTQDEARVVSLSGGLMSRDFTLTQSMFNYDFWQRMSTSDPNGMPLLSTPDAAQLAQASLQHVVLTYSPLNGRHIYVNGVDSGAVDPTTPGNFNDWDDTFAFLLGNEVSGDRQWQGIIKFVAIHNHALTPEQIAQNFKAGVGERYYLLFSVSHYVDDPGCLVDGKDSSGATIKVPQCYVALEVSRYDNYAYLFNTPFFVSLNAAVDLSSVPMKGMRVGINGREVSVGQVWRKLDTTLDVSVGQPGHNKHVISPLGTVVAVSAGPAADEFFLTFEQLGSHSHVVIEPTPTPPPPPVDLPKVADIGVRTFDQINASMAKLTGVSANDANVKATFLTVKQSLPAIEDLQSFLSSHQMAITQMSISYCNALVENAGLRANFFPGVDFNASASTAFTAAGRKKVLDPLLTRFVGLNLPTQPTDAESRTELDSLITRLTVCGANCPADRTRTVVKSVCSATLGSAAMLVQ